MTFREIENTLPNGFHDAKIESLSVDYKTGALSISMRMLIGTPGMPGQEDYGPAELRVNRLLFCSVEPPDPTYPYAPDGNAFNVQGDDGIGDSPALKTLREQLPPGASMYRFFVEEWNSFIYIAGSEIEISRD
jgi:hypothetical protein